MSQNNDHDPLTFKGFMFIFAMCLLFWGATALIAIVLYFPEVLRQ